jgi:hypothetical protein
MPELGGTDEIEERPNLIIVDFDSAGLRYAGGLPEQISEMIQEGVINTGLFNVLERSKLQTIMTEQGWTNSGMVESNSVIQMGKMLGAGFVMTGKIISMDTEQKNFRGYGVSTQTTFITLRANAQVMETETGKIIFSKTVKAEDKMYESNSLANADSGVFVKLAEQIANEIVKDIRKSPQFKQKSEAPGMAKVDIRSIPEMADVELNGVFYGNANGEMLLPTGMHTLKISIAGYHPWEKKILISDTTKVLARLTAVQGL